MGIFKKNKNILSVFNYNYDFISGIEFISQRALNNGINNIFLDGKLLRKIPEINKTSFFKITRDIDLLWTSIYSLAITNRRVMAFCYDQSFFDFTNLEKYFIVNKNLNGGVVLFFLKKQGLKKISFSFESIFPIYNYYKISEFIDYLPYYFELSQNLKLPVLIYVNDSVVNEYNLDEKKAYTERTAAKPNFSLNGSDDFNLNQSVSYELNYNTEHFKNTGRHIELFKGKTSDNLILTDAEYFHRIIENNKVSQNSDIILFNLLNPIDAPKFVEIIKSNCNNFYGNIYIFDDKNLLGRQIANILQNDRTLLNYKNIKLIEAKDYGGFRAESEFCADDFTMPALKTPKSFCIGCNLFTFLHALEKKINKPENYQSEGGINE